MTWRLAVAGDYGYWRCRSESIMEVAMTKDSGCLPRSKETTDGITIHYRVRWFTCRFVDEVL